MPVKMMMIISNGNNIPNYNINRYNHSNIVTKSFTNKNINTPKPISIGLNGSIIGRIHTTKPGCSSCGKK